MSMISEQAKKLREIAKNFKEWEYNRFYDAISEAADTIESLSAKLQAANMERSEETHKMTLKEAIEHLNDILSPDKEWGCEECKN